MKDDADQEDTVAAFDVQIEESTGVNDNANGAEEDVATTVWSGVAYMNEKAMTIRKREK